MQPDNHDGYQIWAVDNVVYGPVNLTVLIRWIHEERVTAETWIYAEANDAWVKAGQMTELRSTFQELALAQAALANSAAREVAFADMKPAALRRIKILAVLRDEQLVRMRTYLTLQPVLQWTVVVRKGDPGDAMYLLLEGEMRVRLMIAGKESTLATLAPGDFFGEFCLFDHGPRSADVVANRDCQLLRLSAASYQRLVAEAPDLAAPFLTSICKTQSARMRANNKRFWESILLSRTMQTEPD